MSDWKSVESMPSDGREVLVYRPLAENSGDRPIAVKRAIGGNNHCWEKTVPVGHKPINPSDGSCHVTHWMDLPKEPKAD